MQEVFADSTSAGAFLYGPSVQLETSTVDLGGILHLLRPECSRSMRLLIFFYMSDTVSGLRTIHAFAVYRSSGEPVRESKFPQSTSRELKLQIASKSSTFPINWLPSLSAIGGRRNLSSPFTGTYARA
jgi:hypothetical protein